MVTRVVFTLKSAFNCRHYAIEHRVPMIRHAVRDTLELVRAARRKLPRKVDLVRTKHINAETSAGANPR